jgi:hypothetical protein
MGKHNQGKSQNTFKEILAEEKNKRNRFDGPKNGVDDKHPAFSFKHFELGHRKYSHKSIADVSEYHSLIEHLTGMSKLVWKEIKTAEQYHAHPIEWNETTEPHGFKNVMLKEYPAFQFKAFKEARIIGFFNKENVYEIIWIDRLHEVYRRR